MDASQYHFPPGCSDQFYQPHMKGVQLVMEVEELNRLLADGKPVVIFLPPTVKLSDLEHAGLSYKPDRTLRLRTKWAFYPVLTFYGAESELGLEEVFERSVVQPNEPDPS
jgi:hypothetical protein